MWRNTKRNAVGRWFGSEVEKTVEQSSLEGTENGVKLDQDLLKDTQRSSSDTKARKTTTQTEGTLLPFEMVGP